MKSFIVWLENRNNITIDLHQLAQDFDKKVQQIINGAHQQHLNVNKFNYQQFMHDVQTTLARYPLLKNLIRSLESKNYHYILSQMDRLRQWLNEQPYDYKKRQENQAIRNVSREIYTYIDTFTTLQPIESTESWAKQQMQQAIASTEIAMEKLKQLIQETISRIHKWNDSPIRIEAVADHDEYGIALKPTDGANIHIGQGEYAPSFSMFKEEGKFVIDDVIDGGDQDFFSTPQLQSDYFNLINEIKKPGSTSKGKILTLYTARPQKDRNFYLKNKKLPVNVFLANNLNHVEGLASDLGAGEIRDIWKVRIDSKYLTQTLDGPTKYYQVSTPDAPVASMELL